MLRKPEDIDINMAYLTNKILSLPKKAHYQQLLD